MSLARVLHKITTTAMPTKKQLLSAYHNRTVTCTAENMRTIEDWPAYTAEMLAAIPGSKLEPDGTLLLPNNQFVRKPTIPRVRTGTFRVRSTFYEFTDFNTNRPSRGELTDLGITPDGHFYIKTFHGGRLVYKLQPPDAQFGITAFSPAA